MKFHTWKMGLTIETPFLFGGDASLQSMIDTPLYRDEHERIAIPGPHISGRFRHFLIAVAKCEDEAGIPENQRLARWNDIRDWFGISGRQLRNAEELDRIDLPEGKFDEPERDAANRPARGRLTFRDIPIAAEELDAAEDPGDECPIGKERTRIRVSAETGAVADGAWQVIEIWKRSGAPVRFAGASDDPPSIELFADDAGCARFEAAFEQFKTSLVAIGANKGQGFGRVREEKIGLSPLPAKPLTIPAAPKPETRRLQLTFSLSHPLLVEPEINSGNLLRSDTVISGAVIKAAIAEIIDMAHPGNTAQYHEALSALYVGHFRPAPIDGMPESVAGDDQIWQDLGSGQLQFLSAWDLSPSVIGDGELVLPAEQKTADTRSHEAFTPEVLNRTRTAIENEAFTAAEHQLFNYQCISPKGTVWVGDVVLPEHEPHRSNAACLIEVLKQDIVRVGKLRSRVINLKPDVDSWQGPDLAGSSLFRIRLRTPCHLICAEALTEIENGRSLRDVYADIFKSRLTAFTEEIDWTRFRIAVHHGWSRGIKSVRYPQVLNGATTYLPYLLTQPGSAFLLKLEPGIQASRELCEKLTEWRTFGLEPANAHLGWQEMPYQRENGYGAVDISGERRSASNRHKSSGAEP